MQDCPMASIGLLQGGLKLLIPGQYEWCKAVYAEQAFRDSSNNIFQAYKLVTSPNRKEAYPETHQSL